MLSMFSNQSAGVRCADCGDSRCGLGCQKRLTKAGALRKAILTSASFSIIAIATDELGAMQLFNVGAVRMLGYSSEEVIGRISPSDIHDAEEVQARAQALTLEFGTPISAGFESLAYKASRGMEDVYELTYLRKDGSRLPAVVSVTALRDDDNAIIGYLFIGTDNSERKRVEQELHLAIQAAEEANRAKSDFLSSMSHELRTPLNAILGFAQLIDASTPDPTSAQKRNVEHILKGGWYLLELINEVLDLALIESGRLMLSQEPTEVAQVLEECRAMIEPQAQQRGIELHFPTCANSMLVHADRIRLKQVLINLMFNAVKYNKPQGSVTVECCVHTEDAIRIQVRDTGVGLSEAQLGQLFQAFNRLGKEAGTEEGTGIGLVVTKRLVELMGGNIGAQSSLGEGSVFWVDLPRSSPGLSGCAVTAGQLLPPVPLHTDAPKPTVLYVEDNPANLDLVAQLIARRDDLHFLSAPDGNTGVALARTHLPTVILMDINLPGVTGLEAMRLLRSDPSTTHIPIIAVSANAVARDVERGLPAGFHDYITKPIKVTSFMETLDAALASGAKAWV